MKKLFLILTLALATITASAQTEHFKFLGIPLDGSISNFTSKLQAKGFTISPDNKKAPVGVRMFEGTFYNHNVQVVVFYDSKTSTVYESKVMFDSYNEDELKRLRAEIEDGITSKYLNQTENTYAEDGSPISNFYIYLSEGTIIPEASIQIWYSEFKDVYPTQYRLSLAYIDYNNLYKYQDSKNADL